MTRRQRNELDALVRGNVSALGRRLFGTGGDDLAQVITVGVDDEEWLA